MSSHSSEPFNDDFDRVIRDALMAAVDSVEPGGDGLERIRAKIVVRQAVRASRWRIPHSRGAARWRPFQLSGAWLTAMSEAVVERFKPDPNRAGWFGWLRPAAAIATGVFVVTAASWAVAALPAAIAPVNNSRHFSPGPAPSSLPGKSSRPGYSSSSGGVGGSGPGAQGGSSGAGTPSCSPPASTSPSATTTPSITPTITPSSTSPGTSPSTGTPTSPDTTAPETTPSDSISAGQNPPTPTTSVSPAATGKALLDAASSAELGVTISPALPTATQTPGPVVSPVPSASVTPQPSQPGGQGPCG